MIDFTGLKVLVVGDPLTDVYHFGLVDRISPEAPVPVFVEDRVETRWGGAANVCHQIIALGVSHYTYFPDRPWEEKHRYMVGSHQMFRVDIPVRYEHPEDSGDTFGFDAIILSDYGKGWLSPSFCQNLIQGAIKKTIPVIVDPKGSDWSKYQGATVICPNEREYAQWDRRSHFDRLVVKLGEKGMNVIEKGKDHVQIPAMARHVFDVTGAGDVVVAIISCALASGASLPDAATLASHAAGYVVGEVGTAVCPLEKLKELVA